MLAEMQAGDFCGIMFFLTVWGQKPGQEGLRERLYSYLLYYSPSSQFHLSYFTVSIQMDAICLCYAHAVVQFVQGYAFWNSPGI